MKDDIQMEELVSYKQRWFQEKLKSRALWNLRDASHLLLTNEDYILLSSNGRISDEYIQEIVKGIVGIGEDVQEAYGEAYATPAAFLRWVEASKYEQRIPDDIKVEIRQYSECSSAAEAAYQISIDTKRKRCEIGCRGKVFSLKLKLGHRYVASLVESPNRVLQAHELYNAIKGVDRPHSHLEVVARSSEAGLLKREIERLLADKESATTPMEREEIQSEIDVITHELQKIAKTHYKKIKNIDAKKIHNSIGKNINQAIREITEHCPVLGEHLLHSIRDKYSSLISYSPSDTLEIEVFH